MESRAARRHTLLAAVVCLLGLPVWVSAGEDQGAVRIRGGTFVMGIEAAMIEGLNERYGIDVPGAFENELPAHRVTVGDFRLDRHEVTNAVGFIGFRCAYSLNP